MRPAVATVAGKRRVTEAKRPKAQAFRAFAADGPSSSVFYVPTLPRRAFKDSLFFSRYRHLGAVAVVAVSDPHDERLRGQSLSFLAVSGGDVLTTRIVRGAPV